MHLDVGSGSKYFHVLVVVLLRCQKAVGVKLGCLVGNMGVYLAYMHPVALLYDPEALPVLSLLPDIVLGGGWWYIWLLLLMM